MAETCLTALDLFCGCGGLTDGVESCGRFELLAAVDWELSPVKVLRTRLKSKYGRGDADRIVMRFDITRTNELFNGWSDDVYGDSEGLLEILGERSVDVVFGGPPCQAYSVAGRIRDPNGMKNDYRNYLFEAYVDVLTKVQPKAFLFENVPGLLSAMPGDGEELIVDKIREAFEEAGYVIPKNLSETLINMEEYGVPQKRKRVILFGVSNPHYGAEKAENLVSQFYKVLGDKTAEKRTVREAIGDLPKLYPLSDPVPSGVSHAMGEPPVQAHLPRRHNERDMRVFRLLAEDLESGQCQYTDIASLKELYTRITGHVSNIHKYHVLRWDEPSNLIPAHLYKDGLRHIHPDPQQARTLTVREAARLQTFPDDFEFGCSATDAYKMIGNAVPPLFGRIAAAVVHDVLTRGAHEVLH